MTKTVLTYLDGYCERAGGAGLWAEPVNLVTNLFFLLAAVAAGRALVASGKRGNASLDLWFLTFFLFAIGIGSGLWHGHPTKLTVLMDVIPITLFINLYIVSSLRRLFGLAWGRVVLWWGAYFAAGLVAQFTLPPDLLNGTIMYIPTYATLVLMTACLWRRDALLGRVFIGALLVWSASLTFRTLDIQFCASFSLGTHFLWHTLNAWVLWRLLMVLVRR